jgi:hypothetical protein
MGCKDWFVPDQMTGNKPLGRDTPERQTGSQRSERMVHLDAGKALRIEILDKSNPREWCPVKFSPSDYILEAVTPIHPNFALSSEPLSALPAGSPHPDLLQCSSKGSITCLANRRIAALLKTDANPTALRGKEEPELSSPKFL